MKDPFGAVAVGQGRDLPQALVSGLLYRRGPPQSGALLSRFVETVPRRGLGRPVAGGPGWLSR